MNAPFEPVEGLIVPEIYEPESICLKMTFWPKQTFFFILFSMLSWNCTRSDSALAFKMRIFDVSGSPSFYINAFCSSSFSSKLPAGRIWKIELR